MTLEAYGEDVGKSFSPLQLRKKLSRKSMRKVSSKPNMKAVRRPLPTPPVEIEPQVRVIEGDDDYELDEREVRLVHFYREAVAEIASSRARFPDTKAALEALSCTQFPKPRPCPTDVRMQTTRRGPRHTQITQHSLRQRISQHSSISFSIRATAIALPSRARHRLSPLTITPANTSQNTLSVGYLTCMPYLHCHSAYRGMRNLSSVRLRQSPFNRNPCQHIS